MDLVIRNCDAMKPNWVCLEVSNLTNESIQFSFNKQVIPNTVVDGGAIVKFSCNFPAANQVVIAGVKSGTDYGNLNDATSTLVVFPKNLVRKPLTSSKSFPFYIVWVLCVATIIIGAVFAKKADAMKFQAYCQSENLSDEECQENIEMGNATGGPSSTPMWIIVCVAAVVLVAAIVFWIFADGPLRWATLSECKQRTAFNEFWFWVTPKSGFRKFLCNTFGACECASDVLQSACARRSQESDRSYSWDEKAAAMSRSKTDTCFCCASHGCIDPIQGTFCSL